MKKRILALALAGTTAFSMFGGLNVFAMSSDSDEFETYTAVSVDYQYDAATGKGALGDHKTPYTSTSMISTVMTFDEAMEENVEAGTVYLYNFYDSHIAADRYTVANVKTALGEEDSVSALAKILAVTKAVAAAEKVDASSPKLISKVEGAIADIDAALNYADIPLGWSKDAAGKWIYTADGYKLGADGAWVK